MKKMPKIPNPSHFKLYNFTGLKFLNASNFDFKIFLVVKLTFQANIFLIYRLF